MKKLFFFAMLFLSPEFSLLIASSPNNPTDCAMLIAKKLSTDPNYIDDLVDMAQYMGVGRETYACQLIDYVLQMPHVKENLASMYPFHFEVISSCYHNSGQNDKAIAFLSQVLADVEGLNKQRKEVITRYVVNAYADIGEYNHALQITDKYASNHYDNEDYEKSISARWLTYIAFAASGNERKEYALELLYRAYNQSIKIQDVQWKADSMNYIVYGFLKCGDIKRALAVAEEIDDTLNLIAIDEERLCPVRFRVSAMIGVAQKLAETEQLAEAIEVLDKTANIAEKIEHRYLKAEMMKDVSIAYAGAGKYVRSYSDIGMHFSKESVSLENAKALQVANAIEHPLIKGITLNQIAQKLIKSGDTEKGIQIASQALEVIQNIADDSRDAYEGELGFEEMSKPIALADITESFVKTCTSKPDLQASKNCTIQHIDSALQWLSKTDESPYAYSKIAQLYAEIGEHQKAVQVAMKLMKGKSLWIGAELIEKLALNAAEMGQYNEALDMVAALEEGFRTSEEAKTSEMDWYQQVSISYASNIRKVLSVKLAEKGQYERSLKVLSEIKKPAVKALALVQIGTYYPKTVNILSNEAKNILRNIAKEAQSMKIN